MLKENRLVLRNAGLIDPLNIDQYISRGGYQAFKNVLERPREEILNDISQSGLKGRGGAGFPTGFKTQATSQSDAVCLKYVVCNADEGEPGTFKDRIIMERDPHSLIEGMLIAARSIGAIWGYIYIRGEYFEAIQTLKIAIEQAYKKGFLGDNIAETDFSFRLELMVGAGSYLCGEELTLLESLEGKRGYPRIKPPFPAQKGLWQQPTLVNNVETLANLPVLFTIGVEKYLKLGTEGTPGTKLICLSGDIILPGTYEVEPGCTIRDIIFDLGGGIPNYKKIKAVLLGGAAGTFANESQLSTQLGFVKMREKSLTMGSGAIIVLSEESSMVKTVTSILEFFKHESCGKCVPCRVGTAHMVDIWNEAKLKSPDERMKAINQLEVMATDMAATSLCPLGQSPILPIKSLVQNCLQSILEE